MRACLIAAAAPLLLAQGAHYEGGTLIAPATLERTIRLPRSTERIPTLAFTPPDGRTRTLELPPELDGRLGRCIQISHHQGTTCAVGFIHAPLPPGKVGQEAMKQAYFQQPRRLYTCGPDGRWTLEARLQPDTTHRRWLMLPLGQGRFLYGHPQLCWQGDAVSPFGVYRAEGGQLHLERLVDLGLGGPWYRAVPFPPGTEEAQRYGRQPKVSEAYQELEGHPEAWQVLRLPSGLCFLHRKSRRWFLLDDQATRCLRQGRVGSVGVEEVLTAAVRPDGRLVVATRLGASQTRTRAWLDHLLQQYRLQQLQTPGGHWLSNRLGAIRPDIDKESFEARWWVVDPHAGSWSVPPPRGVILEQHPLGFLSDMTCVVLPDGNLELRKDEIFSRRPARIRYDWLNRLLKPFTHDWRKLEP